MSLATMFQKNAGRNLIVMGLTAAMTISSGAFPQNANADEPAQTVPTSEQQQANYGKQQAPDDDVMDVANYAKEHNTVAIWICAPMDSGETPQQLAEIAEKGFQQMGIPGAKGFSAVGANGGSRIIIFVGDEPYISPTGNSNFDLHNIKGEIASIKAAYDEKNSTRPRGAFRRAD